jgi:dTDP-4-amino-4,6-dideoxygalactose transaminase
VKISKEANGSNNNFYSTQFTSSCRDAINQILLKHKGPRKILLPAYVGLSFEEGSGILDPIKGAAAEFSFYVVDDQLDPDLNSLETQLETFRPTHVLIVNYFGFLIKHRKSIYELLAGFSACTIEDFAHLVEPLRSRSKVPKYADYEVFSLHKTIGSNLGGGAILSENFEESFAETIATSTLSSFAKSDLGFIASVRSRNYEHLMNLLRIEANPNFTCFFKDMRIPISPLNFPVRFSDGKKRHRFYTELVSRQIFPTALYHRLVPEITQEKYPTSILVSQTILNLPVHQDIAIADLDQMIEVMKDI